MPARSSNLAGFGPGKEGSGLVFRRYSAFLAPVLVADPMLEVPIRPDESRHDLGNRRNPSRERRAPLSGEHPDDRTSGRPWTTLRLDALESPLELSLGTHGQQSNGQR